MENPTFAINGTIGDYLASLDSYLTRGEIIEAPTLPTFESKLLKMGIMLPEREVLYPGGRKEWLIQTSQDQYQEGKDTAIVVIAHPDDEAFVGGLIRKLRKADKQVVVIALTSGNASTTVSQDAIVYKRREEAKHAMEHLDVQLYLNVGFDDGDLLYKRPEAVQQLVQYFRIFDAAVVLGHNHNDYHEDHNAASAITAEALFKARNANHLIQGIPITQTIPSYYEMDTQGSQTETGHIAEVTHVIKLTGKDVDEKASAFAKHGSQVFEIAPDGKSTHLQRLFRDTRRRGQLAGTRWGEGISLLSFGGERFSPENRLARWLGKKEVITIPSTRWRRRIMQIKGTFSGMQEQLCLTG